MSMLDKDAVLAAIEACRDNLEYVIEEYQDTYRDALLDAKEAIEALEEVGAHGYWAKGDPWEGFPYMCSYCEEGELGKSAFCPHCGAKMDIPEPWSQLEDSAVFDYCSHHSCAKCAIRSVCWSARDGWSRALLDKAKMLIAEERDKANEERGDV